VPCAGPGMRQMHLKPRGPLATPPCCPWHAAKDITIIMLHSQQKTCTVCWPRTSRVVSLAAAAAAATLAMRSVNKGVLRVALQLQAAVLLLNKIILLAEPEHELRTAPLAAPAGRNLQRLIAPAPLPPITGSTLPSVQPCLPSVSCLLSRLVCRLARLLCSA
jgi:hypothetical protein